MDDRKRQFIEAVVGEDGAAALVKACSASEQLAWAIVPRTLLAWLETVGALGFDGTLPGVSGTRLSLHKSAAGYSGRVNVQDEIYQFDGASIFHVAGAVAVSLGAARAPADELGHPQLHGLGKSIDLLVKSRTLRKIAMRAPKAAGAVKLPGQAAAPQAPVGPTGPTATQEEPQMATGSTAGTSTRAGGVPRPPKPKAITKKPQLKVTKAEAARPCLACGERQFRGASFTGCLCFHDLSKSVRVTPAADAYVLDFGPAWDANAILTLIENLKDENE